MNFPMGHGVYTWPNGSRYEGQVYKAIRHGTGVHASGDQQVTYAGEWYMGVRHGKVTCNCVLYISYVFNPVTYYSRGFIIIGGYFLQC